MSYEYKPVDWTQFEASRQAVLVEQDVIQATIDESMRQGDLFEAGVACLDHVLTSYDLGDQKEGATYLALGITLSTAGTFAVAEHLRHQPRDKQSFELPYSITGAPLTGRITRRGNTCNVAPATDDTKLAEKAIEEIETNLISTEVLVNNEFCSVSNKNQAVHDTVKSIGDFCFDFIEPDKQDDKIVKLVKDLTENIEIDEDPNNQKLAFDTFNRLALLATYTPGKTNSALSLASRGFKELLEVTGDEFIREGSANQIKTIRLTQIARLASTPGVAINRFEKINHPYVFTKKPEEKSIRVSIRSRQAARGDYHRIQIDHKLYEMRQAYENR